MNLSSVRFAIKTGILTYSFWPSLELTANKITLNEAFQNR